VIVAGLVVETLPQTAERVAQRLAGVPGVEVHGTNEFGVAITWSGDSREELAKLSEGIVSGDDDVVGVHSTYVGDPDDEPADDPASHPRR
jgi:nitrate reductase NapAB chaperone NapD